MRFLTCFATGLLAAAPFGAQAQTVAYPQKTVTLVTHSSPGGGSDVFLRAISRQLGPLMGVNFVVENVRGGSGAAAVAKVAAAPPDGSMFYATTPTYIQTTLLSKPKVGYDGLDPTLVIFFDPQVVYTRADAPWKSLKEAIDHARASGGKSRWGAANPASLERISMERLARLADVKIPIVTHEGGADLMINILNGTLDMGVGEIQEIAGQLEAGKVRLLGTLSDQRLANFPDLPTAKEQGFNLVVRKFRGLAGPKGMSDDIAALWREAVAKVIESPAYKAEIARESLIVALMGRNEARAFTTAFVDEITASLKELGVVK